MLYWCLIEDNYSYIENNYLARSKIRNDSIANILKRASFEVKNRETVFNFCAIIKQMIKTKLTIFWIIDIGTYSIVKLLIVI